MRARADARAGGWAAAAMAGALALLVAACGGADSSDAGPTATVPPAPAVTTTTNPYAVPEVIDAAYVNRVLAGLDAAYGEVVRLVKSSGTIPREAFDRLEALYDNEETLQLHLDDLSLALHSGFKGYRPDPGNQESLVLELISAGNGCVFSRISRDFSAVVSIPRQLEVEWIGLRRLATGAAPDNYNPTSWSVVVEGIAADGSAPENPCARGN